MTNSAFALSLRRAAHAALGLALLAPAAALANGAEKEVCSAHDGCFQFNVHGYYIINFVVFVAILVWFGKKPLREMLDKRYMEVAKEIEAAKVAKGEAEAQLAEYQGKLAQLADENQRLLAQVRAGTEVEVANILAEARAQVDRAAAEETLRLTQESKRLRDQLQRDTAQLALQLAEELVRQQLDTKGQKNLVDVALAELEALPQSGVGAA